MIAQANNRRAQADTERGIDIAEAQKAVALDTKKIAMGSERDGKA
jgi:hypothetical protein